MTKRQPSSAFLPEKTIRPADVLRSDTGHAAADLVKKPADAEAPCSNCGGERDRPGQYYCRKCHNAYQRQKQAAQRELLRWFKGTGLKGPA